MSLIQIAAQELAAPGTHRHKTNTPREFSATADRADNSVSLTPTAFFLWDQVECKFTLAAAHDRLSQLLLIRREDLNALSASRDRDIPLLRARRRANGGIGEQDMIDCLALRSIRRDGIPAENVSKVWEHITDPQKIAGWLMPNDFEAKVGKKFFIDCPHKGKLRCVVKEIIPNEKLVYSLQSEIPKADTLMTITLAQEGKTTRVTLVHSGWDALPPAEQDKADDYGEGWSSGLEQLRLQIERI
jgi:uncharacterized protein YndB with AHSA1/START domain